MRLANGQAANRVSVQVVNAVRGEERGDALEERHVRRVDGRQGLREGFAAERDVSFVLDWSLLPDRQDVAKLLDACRTHAADQKR